MITPQYCQRMAQHNLWQNNEMSAAMSALSETQLWLDRSAFFGSIQGTANHLLWGDLTWLSRFDSGAGPETALENSTAEAADLVDWQQKRQALDQRFLAWANGLTAADMDGDFSWYSGAMQRDFSLPKALCLMQMFNHQTHHRGQIHAMVTAAGGKGWTTDLPFMPPAFAKN